METVIYLQTESRRLARQQCDALGITATQLNIIKMLDELGHLSLSELSRRIAAKNSTVTGIVDRMVQAELVTRQQSDEDRRVWHITLTPKSHEIAGRLHVAPWDLLRSAIRSLSTDEQTTLTHILRKLAAHVTAAAAAEPFASAS